MPTSPTTTTLYHRTYQPTYDLMSKHSTTYKYLSFLRNSEILKPKPVNSQEQEFNETHKS